MSETFSEGETESQKLQRVDQLHTTLKQEIRLHTKHNIGLLQTARETLLKCYRALDELWTQEDAEHHASFSPSQREEINKSLRDAATLLAGYGLLKE